MDKIVKHFINHHDNDDDDVDVDDDDQSGQFKRKSLLQRNRQAAVEDRVKWLYRDVGITFSLTV